MVLLLYRSQNWTAERERLGIFRQKPYQSNRWHRVPWARHLDPKARLSSWPTYKPYVADGALKRQASCDCQETPSFHQRSFLAGCWTKRHNKVGWRWSVEAKGHYRNEKEFSSEEFDEFGTLSIVKEQVSCKVWPSKERWEQYLHLIDLGLS